VEAVARVVAVVAGLALTVGLEIPRHKLQVKETTAAQGQTIQVRVTVQGAAEVPILLPEQEGLEQARSVVMAAPEQHQILLLVEQL